MTQQTPRKTTKRDIEIGFRIRQIRQAKDISQTEVADRCGIRYQQIAKYEFGRDRISVERLAQIADILGVTVNELLKPEKLSRKGSQSTNQQDIDEVAANLWNGLRNNRQKQVIVQLMETLQEPSLIQPQEFIKRDS